MIYSDGVDARMEVRSTQRNPCNGTYTLLVPEDREEARPLTLIRATGVALAKGTYRVRVERVADA